MAIKIPPSEKDLIQALLDLSHEERDALVQAFRDVPSTTTIRDFGQVVASSMGREPDRIGRLVRLFVSLQVARFREEEAARPFAQQFVTEIRALIPQHIPRDESRDEAYWDRIAEQVAAVLSSERAVAIVNAMDLLRENERIFMDARILTEMRPVFGEEADELPIAGIVLHTLKLDYRNEGEDRSFYVVLDTNDLKKLRDKIDRSLKKESAIQKLTGGVGWTLVRSE